MFFCCECCVLACRGLCDEFITRPEESYRPWCVVECNLETAWWGGRGSRWPAAPKKKKKYLRFSGLRFRWCCVEWWDSYEGVILNCVERSGGGVV
jgi:hypothetical protein